VSAGHRRRLAFSLLALVALVLLPAGAMGQPAGPPIANPNTGSQGAQDAHGYTNATVSATEEVFEIQLNDSFTVPNGAQWQLTNYTEEYYDWFNAPKGGPHTIGGPLPGAHYIRATTWVNLTTGCNGPNSCPVTYACDGTSSSAYMNAPQSWSTANPCLYFFVNFTHRDNLANEPEWEVTRIVTTVLTSSSTGFSFGSLTWESQGRTDYGYANFSTMGFSTFCPRGWAYCPYSFPELFGSGGYFRVIDTYWWVPYPSGNWYLPDTTFQSRDTGVTYPQSDYAIGTGAFFAQWNATAWGSGTDSVFNQYLFTLTALATKTVNNTGNVSKNSGTNSTGAAPPVSTPQVGEVVLTLANVSALNPGEDTSNAIWIDPYAYNFTGQFFLEANWLANAANVTLFVNGQPLPPFDYSVSAAAIVVFAGIVSVTTEEGVSFVADYSPTSTFTSFYSPLAYLDGYAVNAWGVLLLIGVGASFAVVWMEVDERGRKRGQPTLGHRLLVIGLAVIYGALVFAL
jgi:hypothetical protein